MNVFEGRVVRIMEDTTAPALNFRLNSKTDSISVLHRHASMSLVRGSYRKRDSDDEAEDLDALPKGPPTKKAKTCAPIESETPQPSFPPYTPFVPLSIIHPQQFDSQPSSHGPSPRFNPKKAPLRPIEVQEESLVSSPPNWDVQLASIHGSLFDTLPLVQSALEYTAKKGQKESRVPRRTKMSLRPMQGHSGPVYCVKWSPKGATLMATASGDGSVKLWDPFRTSCEVASWRSSKGTKGGGIKDVAFSGDGRSLLFGGYGGKLYQVDIETGAVLIEKKEEAYVTSVGEVEGLILSGLSSGSLFAYDPRDPSTMTQDGSSSSAPSSITQMDSSGRYVRRISGLPGSVSSFCFLTPSSSSSPKLATSCESSGKGSLVETLVVWDWHGGRALSRQLLAGESFACYSVQKHPILNQFAAQSSSGHIPVFSSLEPWKRKKKKVFNLHKIHSGPSNFSWSPDGSLLYASSSAGQIYVYQYANSKLLTTIPVFDAKEACIGLAHHPVLNSVIAVTGLHGSVTVRE